MNQRHKALLTTLRRLDELLKWEGDTHWRAWISECIELIGEGYPSGVDYLLKAYGGMGSINDLNLGFIPPDSWREGARGKNEQFDRLLSQAYDLAKEIERDHSADA